MNVSDVFGADVDLEKEVSNAGQVQQGEGQTGEGGDNEQGSATSEGQESESSQESNSSSQKQSVDLAAKYREEQGYRKRLSKELKAAKEEVENMRNLLYNQIVEIRANQKSPEKSDNDVDPEQDPVGFIKKELLGLREEIKNLKQSSSEIGTKTSEKEMIENLQSAAKRSFTQFAKKQDDFRDALAYLDEQRMEELTLLGLSESQAQAAIDRDILAITQQAINNEQSPAEIFYKIAKQRGFKSTKDIKTGVSRMIDGQDKNKSLSQAGKVNSSNVTTVSIEQLLGAKDKEFEELWDKFTNQ